nr:hypothetical protein [Tanacetum cinerariifolium]
MCITYTDVAQVANAARNYEILHERDDEDTERPDKRQKNGDRHQPTSQQSSHRSYGHNNDRQGSDRRGAAGTEEDQEKNFQWGLRRSTLNHLMCMSYTDVAQVANAARNYEILYERDDEDTERPDKRQRSGDRHQPTSQQSSHRSHGQNNDRRGSDRRGGSDNHRSGSNNNNYSSSNNRTQRGQTSGKFLRSEISISRRVLCILRPVNNFRQRGRARHQQNSQQRSHRRHGQNNDRQGSDRRGGYDNHRGNNISIIYSCGNNRSSNERVQVSSVHEPDPTTTL